MTVISSRHIDSYLDLVSAIDSALLLGQSKARSKELSTVRCFLMGLIERGLDGFKRDEAGRNKLEATEWREGAERRLNHCRCYGRSVRN